MNLKTFCLTAATVAALSLSATSVYAEDDDDENTNENTTNENSYQDSGSSRCYGHVIQVKANYEGASSRIYFRTSSRSNRYYYGDTYDPILINAALHALSGPTYVQVYSEKGCGSDGGSGNRYVGGIYRIRVNP